jgi:EamA domain-containing membrane protein RarD
VYLNPMVETVLGALLLGERLSRVFIAGFLAVLGGVVLVKWVCLLLIPPASSTLNGRPA